MTLDFLDLDRFMRDLANLDEPVPLSDTYCRYAEWHRFAARGREFVQSAARDLGLDPAVLYEDPARQRF